MNRRLQIVAAIGMSVIVSHCKQVYEPKVEAKDTGLLVVDGYINSGQGPTTIRLTRTGNLEDSVLRPELNAQVTVEGDNGASFQLAGNPDGNYSIAQLSLDNNVKYRLHIRTATGKEYFSDYSRVKYTPAIDSITWQSENNGLRLYTNSKDLQNTSKYYQWRYEETWEFHSRYLSSLKLVFDSGQNRTILVYRNPDQSADTTIYKCWKTVNTTSIILGSTENLTADMVYLPVQYIDAGSEKLSVLYSINLRQYAISREEYLFLQKMKKNTEEIGTIFDPQPTQLSGNIHCLSDTTEIAIGFVEITEEKTRRIFIQNSQVPGWNYNPDCPLVKVKIADIPKYGVGSDLMPTSTGDPTLYFFASTPACVDCTIGRTNKRPAFWP